MGNRTLYTPPKNLPTAAANQMNFNQRELNIIGHWASSSRMPERYDRTVCATELLLGNTIIQKFVSGWDLAPSFHLPETVHNDQRIGKETPVVPTVDPLELPSALEGTSVPADANSGVAPDDAPISAVAEGALQDSADASTGGEE